MDPRFKTNGVQASRFASLPTSAPPGSKSFGDNSESDPLVYRLYRRIVEGVAANEEIQEQLIASGDGARCRSRCGTR